MGISNVGPTSARPQELAEQLLHMLGGFTRDIATVHKLMGTFYVYMDEREKWQEKGMLQVRNANAESQHPACRLYTSWLNIIRKVTVATQHSCVATVQCYDGSAHKHWGMCCTAP